MAKTLIDGQTYVDLNGDNWTDAVLHVDYTKIDWHAQTLTFFVCVYKDDAARSTGYSPIAKKFEINRAEFLANFSQSSAITTLKAQCEDYALGLIDNHTGVTYGAYFE